ncbi:DUF1796 family putative cysteine peptidase [Bacillus mycoides]|uniref:DUF1796 family putative cysteine peptidase n=1 Tax=Bacillus mycoides TaxID=1405 RepID=UPI0021119005|nr:DUF1796 family putative cysteine peptidase [Bacillus mycoides]MCQ6530981.1 papain-like cysteine peptidase [Bacillus mycoides]
MKLLDIQQNYDGIFSLGNQCLSAYQLREYKLRPYAGPIDWMISFSFQDVICLLQNQFKDFMKKENMVFKGYSSEIKGFLLLEDIKYNIVSVHDFLVTENTPENWTTYPEFKIKINRRIQQFLNKLETCNKILFVRIGGTYEEAQLLEEVLFKIVKNEFRILLLNRISEYKIIEYDWDLQYTCSIGVPHTQDVKIWDLILGNITLDIIKK